MKGSASGPHRYSEGGNTMKSVHEALDQILPEIIAMSEDIYCHPELGFKEFRTRKKAIGEHHPSGRLPQCHDKLQSRNRVYGL